MFKKLPLKIADVILFAAFLLIGVASIFVFTKAPSDDARVVIYQDGAVAHSYALNEDRSVEIKGSLGFNSIEIKDGKVRVAEADCSGGDCANFGWIDKEGEVIICIPHKLLVTIEKGDGYDSVSY